MSGSAEAKKGGDVPASVLFVCNLNAIRSPIAEAILKKTHGARIFVDSVGVAPAEDADPFAAEVLREAGIEPPARGPKDFDELDDVTSFDLIVALTPEARAKVEDLTRSSATDIEYWEIEDPLASPTGGNRERRLDAYRTLRDRISRLIENRFGRAGAATG
ncbi:MAG: low molecular weight phosphatase family protein [Parvibaculum sp.]|uniref:arsenate-mycothiol transferase ArsC n=1 Tax=Parvibaculum sp. TaxID=2024848 RepID=UPI003262FB86